MQAGNYMVLSDYGGAIGLVEDQIDALYPVTLVKLYVSNRSWVKRPMRFSESLNWLKFRVRAG